MSLEYDRVQFTRFERFEVVGVEWESKRRYARITPRYTGEGGDLWVEEETGLVTGNPRKLESWLDKVEGKELDTETESE